MRVEPWGFRRFRLGDEAARLFAQRLRPLLANVSSMVTFSANTAVPDGQHASCLRTCRNFEPDQPRSITARRTGSRCIAAQMHRQPVFREYVPRSLSTSQDCALGSLLWRA